MMIDSSSQEEGRWEIVCDESDQQTKNSLILEG
jgi:hypothetical protein